MGRRSRGTPRIANRLLKRVRDYAQVKGNGRITAAIADQALQLLEVDHVGLDEMDRRILLTIIDKFQGGPIGLDTLATAVCEERSTLEDVYEPFLIQSGFLARTPRGEWPPWAPMSISAGRWSSNQRHRNARISCHWVNSPVSL